MTAGVQFQDDAAARQRIRTSLDESLIAEAAAGTGKTSELVCRIVAVLASGRTTVDRIVAVTFTRKAAGELKLRLRQELDRARTAEVSALHLEHALAHLEEARIGTIHSFCADILRERPVEALVDPAFEELSEAEAGRIYSQAFRRWLEQKLAEGSLALRRAFSRGMARGEDRSPSDRLRGDGWDLIQWRDFPAPWRRPEFDRTGEIDTLVARTLEVAELSARCEKANDSLYQGLGPARDLATWLRRAEQVAARDYIALEGLLVRLCSQLNKRENQRKGSGFFAPGVERRGLVALRDGLLASLKDFEARSGADLAAALQTEMAGLVARYEELKARAGKLDFLDLLLRTRDLVRGNAEVRAYLQQRFTHIFVDEFQDTDPLQAEILLLLSADSPEETDWTRARPAPGKLFLVGDPKQSIYRFRRADVALYEAIKGRLLAQEMGFVCLTTSYRARPAIQECINAAFAPEMTAQPAYVALQPYREDATAQPSVIALPVPQPYGGGRVTNWAINESLPEAAVAFVDWLLKDSGWTVSDGGADVPVQPRHVAVLFRRFVSWGTDMTHPYVRALEARGIPHLLLGSRSFHSREEVETLRAALAAVEWPDDELSVFAALKGPLLAIPDETLLRYRHEVGSLHPFRPAPDGVDEQFQPLVDALGLLAEMHRARNRVPVVATINRLLEATRAHAGFALRPGGNQVLANVYRICDLARAFELSGGVSFRGFVEQLDEQAEREQDSSEAPVLEAGAEGVRIMTVHGAKGLEFPVVVLADMTANMAARHPDRHVDPAGGLCAQRLLGCTPCELRENEAEESARDQAEGVRVAYVAATRARDLLVIPAVGDDPEGGWLGPLNKAIYPVRERRRQCLSAPGCPPFRDDTVLRRPPDFPTTPADSVKPGRHHFPGYDVDWWDPATLRLGVQANFGLRQEEILVEDDRGTVAREGVQRYEEWRTKRAKSLESGARPEFDLFTATDAAGPPPGEAIAVGLETVTPAENRPGGRRFGTLVHAVLREAPLDGPDSALRGLAERHGRVLGAPGDEVEAAITAAAAALAHPLLRRAAAAERRERECPVVLALADGRMVEGVLDLAFLEGGVWNVVDFKTDAAAQRYRTQLAWYAYALSRLTGRPARAWILAI